MPEAMDIAIRAKGLTKQFGQRRAIDNLSFEIPRGAFLTILGPNGAGKTTLLRILSMLLRPSSGSFEISGIDALENPEKARSRIDMVSHASMLYPDLTAEENLVFFGRLYGVADPSRRARELLHDVGLSLRRSDRVRTFSQGMRQRASIARALMNDPDLVLLDEPYSGLDAHGVSIFDNLIESIRKDRTFVMVSHDFDKGMSLASHVMIMERGRTVYFSASGDADIDEVFRLYSATTGRGVA